MSTLRNLNVNLELGQTILVGQNREPAQITKNTPREKMSASWLSSCKSRGLVTRDTDKTQKTDSGRKKHNGLGKSTKYGGWRDTGKGSKAG